MTWVVRWATSVAVAAVALAAAGAAGAGPNLIVNGSFEEPNIPTGTFAIFSSIPGWSWMSRPGTTSFGLEIQDHAAGSPAPGAGDQFLETDSFGPDIVWQDVPTTAGLLYQLMFLYSARPNTPAVQNQFQVTGGPATATIGPLTSGTQTDWQVYTLSFVATGPTSRIEFMDLSPEEAFGGFGSFIDLVSVQSVNRPPDCSALTASPNVLGPPNHTLQTVTISGVTDPDGDPVTIAITSVMQDEPVDGIGDGSTSPDAVAGAAPNQVQLRAERAGGGDGRVYTITIVATDANGATCTGSVVVGVRHGHNGAAAVDSGPLYNSFAP